MWLIAYRQGILLLMFRTVKRYTHYLIDTSIFFFGAGLIKIFKHIPHKTLLLVGQKIGSLAFYAIPDLRKTALTNLALAFPHLSFYDRYLLAKQSIQHVMITFCELLAVESLAKNIDSLISIQTAESCSLGYHPNEVIAEDELQSMFNQLAQNEGVILFCGHQANWELPFLFITKRYPGLALAKPIPHERLNKKIFSLREIFKGKIVTPKNGINQALRALYQGHVVGLVGDQALLMSSYAYPLFGAEAFTTTTPALLSYKTGKPIVAVSVYRKGCHYEVVPSKKIYPNYSLPMKEAITDMMDRAMQFLEKGISIQPEQWMWMHKRWKSKLKNKFKKKYAFSHILILIKETELNISSTFLQTLSELYLGAKLTIAIHCIKKTPLDLPQISGSYTTLTFADYEDLIKIPNIFPAVFATDLPKHIRKHYLRTGTRKVHIVRPSKIGIYELPRKFASYLKKTNQAPIRQ